MARLHANTGHGALTRRLPLAALGLLAALGVLFGVRAQPVRGQGQSSPLDAQRARVRVLEADLLRVDSQQQQAAFAFTTADARLRRLRARIADNARQQRDAARNLAASRARLAARLMQLYAQQPPSMVEVLMSSGSLTGAVDSYEMAQHVADTDRDMLLGFRAARTRLADLRTGLIADRREATTSRALAATKLGQLRGLLAERRRLLVAARSSLSGMQNAAAQRAAVTRDVNRAAAAGTPRATPEQVINAGAPAGAAPAPQDVAAPSGGVSGDIQAHLASIAQCESGGNPRAVSSSGQYRGKYQFSIATWQAMGGVGDPIDAPEAEQDRLAAKLYQTAGPGQWPVCSQR